MKGFETLDWVVIVGYFLVIAGVAIWVMTRKQTNYRRLFSGRKKHRMVHRWSLHLCLQYWFGTHRRTWPEQGQAEKFPCLFMNCMPGW